MTKKFFFAALFFLLSLSANSQTIIVKLKEKNSFALLQKKFSAQPFLTNSTKKNFSALLSTAQKNSFAELEKYFVFDSKKSPDSLLKILRGNPDIDEVYIARKFHIEGSTPNDSAYGEQWALKKIEAARAWERATGKGIKIAFIDTGVDFLHPDLVNQFAVNSKEDINQNGRLDPWPSDEKRKEIFGDFDGIDNDGNGYSDDVIGFDFVDQHVMNVGDARNRDGDPDDEQGHGTSVAGVLAAQQNNSIGISGLAFESKLVALRAFDATGNGEEDDIAASIVYAALNGVRVLNLSFGDVIYSPITRDAIKFAQEMGVVVVASSGNDGGTQLHFPSDYPEVISVGATNQDDRRSFFSSYGSYLTLVAPGEKIFTTALNGGYKFIQGTSFSSPHVAATVALILEANPDLRQEDIRTILESSSDPVGRNNISDREWTTLYGAGRLNAAKAVEAATGKTKFAINFPVRGAEFEHGKWEKIPVLADFATPFFSNAKIEYGTGEFPENWTEIYSSIRQNLSGDTLAFIPFSSLGDTIYTIRLMVGLTNGAMIERRTTFSVVSGKISLTDVKIEKAWYNDRRALVISTRSDRKSNVFVKIPPVNDSATSMLIHDVEKFSRNHTILLPYTTPVPSDSVEVFAISIAGDTVSKKILLENIDEAFPQTGMRRKNFSLPLSYLLNHVEKNFYGDNLPTIVVNDISQGSYDRIKTYQFRDGNFVQRDSGNSWIPRGIGDSNGDGIPEIFAHSRGRSVLFQAQSKDGNPFPRQIFSETQSENFWASDMADIDGDKRSELIARSDSSFLTLKFSNGNYSVIGEAKNSSEPAFRDQRNFFGVPVSASGDFDGDGKKNLAYVDEDGSLLIFEWNGSNFEAEKIFEHENFISAASEFVSSADVDGDGTPEILYGYPLTQNHDNIPDNEYLAQLWNFILIKNIGGEYKEIWLDKIYGVRLGDLYQYGITSGEINGKKGDEIIISTFPNLYTFTWDAVKNSLVPFWNNSFVYTNSALVYDFDRNGINEIGFGAPTENGLETIFFENSQKENSLSAPAGLDAIAQNQSEVFLKWNPVPGAKKYEIFFTELPNSSGQVEFYAETESTTIRILNLKNYTSYGFVVRAVGENSTMSEFSVMADAFTHPPIALTDIRYVSAEHLTLKFSGRVPQNLVDPSVISISPERKISSLKWAGGSTLALTFTEKISPGEYSLSVNVFPDYYRTPSIFSNKNFSIPADTAHEEMYLTRLAVRNNSLLEIFFSDIPDAATASSATNFILSPSGNISHIEVSALDSSAKIFLSEPLEARGKNYFLSAKKEILSANGKQMTGGAGNTLAFTITAPDLQSVYTFPNPVKISRDDRVTFAGLPRFARATVQTLEGKILAELNETDANGGVEWNLQTISGEKISSGVYLIQTSRLNESGKEVEKIMKKFAVVQ